MSKNIRRSFCLVFTARLIMSAASCTAGSVGHLNTSPETAVLEALTLSADRGEEAIPDTASAADTHANPDRIAGLDALFDASLPTPDGSSASMYAYAEGLRELWYGEIEKLIADDAKLSAEFADFSHKLAAELEAEAENYRDGENSPYGSAVGYELTYKHAEALRQWYIANTKTSPES